MLQYIQNVNYVEDNQQQNIDSEIESLKKLILNGGTDYDIYLSIRQKIYREIKIEELAVTRILKDLQIIRKNKKPDADLVEYFILHSLDSYADIAEQFGVTRQAIYQRLKNLSEKFYWIENLMEIKGFADAKNRKGRSEGGVGSPEGGQSDEVRAQSCNF